jgi:hypothetical protein
MRLIRIADEAAVDGATATWMPSRKIERSSIPPSQTPAILTAAIIAQCTSAPEMPVLRRLAALISAAPNSEMDGRRSTGTRCLVSPAGSLIANEPHG